MAILTLLGTPNDSISTIGGGMAMGAVGANLASATVARTGAYSMKLIPSSAQSAYFGAFGANGKKASLALGTAYFTVFFYLSSAPLADVKVVSFGASTTYGTTETARLEFVQSDSTFQLVGSTTSSKTAAVSGSTWYRLDMKIVNGGTCELQLNLATAVTCTGNANNVNYVHLGTNGTDANFQAYLDDGVIADAAITTSDYRIGKLSPNADGNYTGWTASAGSKWDCVEEIPSSSAEYISSGTGAGDQRYSAALESAATGGISPGFAVHAVQGQFRMWEVSSTTTSGSVGIRGGGSDAETTNVDIGSTTNIVMGIVRVTNPGDSAAWEPADLDSMELIVKRSTSDTSNIRCGWMVAEVMYSPTVTLAGAQPASTGAFALIKTLKALAGAQAAPSGSIAAEFIGGVVEISLAGAQPASTGTIRSLQYKALAGAQDAPSGSLVAKLSLIHTALAGAQPAASGALVAEWVNKYVAGAQPEATGALTVKRVLTHIALAGAQPEPSGALTFARFYLASVAGAQPAGAGTVAFKRSLSHFTLAGAQPNGTGALALIKTLKLLAGAQDAPSGALAFQRLLTHVSLTGEQPSATGGLASQRVLTHIALAGNQPNDTGAIAAVSAAFVDLAGNQPEAAGALVALVTSKHLSGDQAAGAGALVVEWLLAHVAGNQPAGSGTIAGVELVTNVGFAPVGGLAVGVSALPRGRAAGGVHLGPGRGRF